MWCDNEVQTHMLQRNAHAYENTSISSACVAITKEKIEITRAVICYHET